MAFLALLVVCLFIVIPLHELGHVILFIIFGVSVDKLVIGLPLILSIPLYNEYVRNIVLGPIPLGGFTIPDTSGALLLSSWQYILIFFAGIAVNISIPLFGARLHKRGRIFSDNMVYFFDLNLALFILNIAPLPGLDGGQALINFLVLLGLIPSVNEFYAGLGKPILLFWKWGGMFPIFFFIRPLVDFMKKFIKYNGRLPARKIG